MRWHKQNKFVIRYEDPNGEQLTATVFATTPELAVRGLHGRVRKLLEIVKSTEVNVEPE
jgi:hypothetical protein